MPIKTLETRYIFILIDSSSERDWLDEVGSFCVTS